VHPLWPRTQRNLLVTASVWGARVGIAILCSRKTSTVRHKKISVGDHKILNFTFSPASPDTSDNITIYKVRHCPGYLASPGHACTTTLPLNTRIQLANLFYADKPVLTVHDHKQPLLLHLYQYE